MIWGRPAVKYSNRGGTNRPLAGAKATGWLDGWTLVIPSAGVAVVAAMLALPRATEPRWVPQPMLHPRELGGEIEQLQQLAVRARARPLPFSVRELGEAYRRLGRTQFMGPTQLTGVQVQAWRDLMRLVHKSVGDEPIQVLRALQCELFVAAMKQWDSTGKINDDLIELGGDFVPLAKANGWLRKGGLDITRQERWALGMKRWTSLAGLLHQNGYQPPRNLELTQLRFFYAHPGKDENPLESRERILKRFVELDSTYPVLYAMGVLSAKNGQLEKAAVYFDKHLESHPDGEFALRARNHLLWATRLRHPAVDNDSP